MFLSSFFSMTVDSNQSTKVSLWQLQSAENTVFSIPSHFKDKQLIRISTLTSAYNFGQTTVALTIANVQIKHFLFMCYSNLLQ